MLKAKSVHRFHVVLSIQQYERLVAKSQETGAPIAELVRRAVDASTSATPREKDE